MCPLKIGASNENWRVAPKSKAESKATKKIVYHARKASKLILLIAYKIKRIQKEHLPSFDNMCHRLGSEK